jgi:ankyrin repeat protein
MTSQVRLVKLLLKRGAVATINHRAVDGKTPLVLAGSIGHIKIIEMLVAHGADVE